MAVDTVRAVPRHALEGESAVLLVAAGAAFLALLDTTVANMAVADVRNDFGGASIGGATWIITIYAVTFAALLAPAGRVADVVGRRTLMLAGISLFTAMSLLCAAAPSLGTLLVARALQGIGAAAMIPASLAIVLFDTPPERRTAAIGAWSAAGALAAAAGPAISGVLVDLEGWRSLFLINLPFGLAILAGTRAIPARAVTGDRRLPDAGGVALLGAGIGAVALGIAQGPNWGWHSAQVVGSLAAGAAAVGWALWRSMHHPTPAIETRLWQSRSFAVANVASLLYGAALFPWLLVGVLFLIQVWQYTPLEAGLAMTPGAIVAALVALRAGPIVAKRGVRSVVVTGALVLGVAGLLGTVALPATPHFLTYWLPVGTLIGIGTGAITTGLSTAAALSVAPPRFAAAIGLNQTGRQVGGALGIAVLAALLQRRGVSGTGPFTDVYLFCTLATLAVAVAALWLVPKGER